MSLNHESRLSSGEMLAPAGSYDVVDGRPEYTFFTGEKAHNTDAQVAFHLFYPRNWQETIAKIGILLLLFLCHAFQLLTTCLPESSRPNRLFYGD